MQKTAPTPARIAVMAVFGLSCFGLFLYLWSSFGGSIPLKPKGYRISVLVPQAAQLATQADVRISGVPVGRIVAVSRAPDNRARAVIELKSRYAPLHSDARAVLRTKTLLGETYMELTPGSRSAPAVPEGGELAPANVDETVALDEIFRAFDEPTRQDFRRWMQAMAMGLGGRGRDLNDVFAQLVPFATDTGRLTATLNRQSAAVRQVVRGTGTVFATLGERADQLQTLLRAGNTTFAALASRDRALADSFRALPGFERSSRTALRALDGFAADAQPVLDDLLPAVRATAPAFRSLGRAAPDLDGLLQGLDALTAASKTGFPAGTRAIGELRPLLTQLHPVLSNLNPLLGVLSSYNREIEALVGNTTAATQAATQTDSGPVHYLRTIPVVRPETLAGFSQQRTGANRANPYPRPGAGAAIGGMPVYDARSCGRGDPVFAGAPSGAVTDELLGLLSDLQVLQRGTPGQSSAVPAPPCVTQPAGTFPHVLRAP